MMLGNVSGSSRRGYGNGEGQRRAQDMHRGAGKRPTKEGLWDWGRSKDRELAGRQLNTVLFFISTN